MKTKNKYYAWKISGETDEQIGEDRFFKSESIANVFSILATEEGIEFDKNKHSTILKLPNGDTWYAKIYEYGEK